VLFIGTQFSNLSTAVDTSTSAACNAWCVFFFEASHPVDVSAPVFSGTSAFSLRLMPSRLPPGASSHTPAGTRCIPPSACTHTCTFALSRGLGRRIHGSVEDTKLSTNKQHSLSVHTETCPSRPEAAFSATAMV